MLHTGYLGLTYDLEHREEDEKKLSVYIENNLRLNTCRFCPKLFGRERCPSPDFRVQRYYINLVSPKKDAKN